MLKLRAEADVSVAATASFYEGPVAISNITITGARYEQTAETTWWGSDTSDGACRSQTARSTVSIGTKRARSEAENGPDQPRCAWETGRTGGGSRTKQSLQKILDTGPSCCTVQDLSQSGNAVLNKPSAERLPHE